MTNSDTTPSVFYGKGFPSTTDDTSHVGQTGHDSQTTWNRFFIKYRSPCVQLMECTYPQWKSEAEDIFQRVTIRLFKTPEIVHRKPTDKFRTVLCKLCIREMRRLHNPHREAAIMRFLKQPFYVLFLSRTDSEKTMEKLKDLIDMIREDLLDEDYVNGRHFRHLDERKLTLWREIQQSGESCTAVANRLGLATRQVNRAKSEIDRFVCKETLAIARKLEYLD